MAAVGLGSSSPMLARAKACPREPILTTTPGRNPVSEPSNEKYSKAANSSMMTDAKTDLFSYIEGDYNTHRKHSSLGYLAPSKYEFKNYKNQPNTGPEISSTSM